MIIRRESMNAKIIFLITFLFSSTAIINTAYTPPNRGMLADPKDTASRMAVEKEWQKKYKKYEEEEQAHKQAVEIVLYNLCKPENSSNNK